MKRPQLARLSDMLDAIDTVAEMTSGVDFPAYRGDVKLRRAVERCVEIVSEASRFLPDEFKALHPDQPWPEIAGIGKLLRHRHQRVDDLIMWKIATTSLPALRIAVVEMIADEE